MTDQTESELLPCPFCGGRAEIERYGDRSKSTIYTCMMCGCSLETGEEWGHGTQWNTRANRKAMLSTEVTEIVQRLRQRMGDYVEAVQVTPTDHEALQAADMLEALAAEVRKWQPIETAPKDGTEFWGNVGDDAIRMFWHSGFNAFVSSFRRWTLHGGATFADTGLPHQDHSPVIHAPTHWIPFINPPGGDAW